MNDPTIWIALAIAGAVGLLAHELLVAKDKRCETPEQEEDRENRD